MRRVLPIALIACALIAGGCGDDSNVAGNEAPSAEQQFELHAGRALGAFRGHILRPYQEGRLQDEAGGALASAERAGEVATQELEQARRTARESGSLRPHLLAPTEALLAALRPLVAELKSGSASPGTVLSAAAAVAALDTAATGYGIQIKDRAVELAGT